MNHSLLAILLVCVLGFIPSQTSFADESHFESVRINYSLKRSTKNSEFSAKALRSAWIGGCKSFGTTQVKGSGPWFGGVFDDFHCQFNGKTFGQKKRASFLIEIADRKTGVTISVVRLGKSRKKNLVLGKIELPPTEGFPLFFKDPEFVDLLALAVRENLPAMSIVNGSLLPAGKLVPRAIRTNKSGKAKYQRVDLPPKLRTFNMKYDVRSQLWETNVHADVALMSDEKVGDYYEIGDEIFAHGKKDMLFLHRTTGPYESEKFWKNTLKDAASQLDTAVKIGKLDEFLEGKKLSLLDTLFSSAASGYVGIKYGLQVLPSEGETGKVVGKTSLLSLLVEIRSGPVKGLRYYYDKLPEKTATVTKADGTQDSQFVGFSRHVLGYSFGIDLGTFINRLTIDPKLGMWEFNARLPAAYNEEQKVTAVEDFNLGRTFSLALEGGLEKVSSWYILRGWAGMDTGFSLLKSGGSVSSYRFGVDAFLSAGPEIPFLFRSTLKTTWVLFYVFDRIAIEKKGNPELAEGENAITGIAYDAAYAGGGVALSW